VSGWGVFWGLARGRSSELVTAGEGGGASVPGGLPRKGVVRGHPRIRRRAKFQRNQNNPRPSIAI